MCVIILILLLGMVLAGFRLLSLQEGLRFVKQLGTGINIGNTLDAHGAWKHRENPSVADYETYWH